MRFPNSNSMRSVVSRERERERVPLVDRSATNPRLERNDQSRMTKGSSPTGSYSGLGCATDATADGLARVPGPPRSPRGVFANVYYTVSRIAATTHRDESFD